MTPDKSLIVVEAVSSGITCPTLLIIILACHGWTVVDLAVSLPASSTSYLYIDTAHTPPSCPKFQISYRRQGKRKGVIEFVKYCHLASSTMPTESEPEMTQSAEEDV